MTISCFRQTHLLESHISGHIVKKRTTLEGEVIPYMMEKIEFGSHLDGSEDSLQLLWPMVVSHRIDSSSPLYSLSPRDILDTQFEIILTLEGVTPETGNTIQVRSSYLPSEILWGFRFEQTCVAYDKEEAKYAVSIKTINSIRTDRTPRLELLLSYSLYFYYLFIGAVLGSWRITIIQRHIKLETVYN